MRDRGTRDFNITLLAAAITRCRHLVVDTHRTNFGSARQVSLCIHEMIVTTNRTCVFFEVEDMITQRINTHVAGTQSAGLYCQEPFFLSFFLG